MDLDPSTSRRAAIKKLSKAARGAKPSKSKSSSSGAAPTVKFQMPEASPGRESEATAGGYYVLDDADLMLMHNTIDQQKVRTTTIPSVHAQKCLKACHGYGVWVLSFFDFWESTREELCSVWLLCFLWLLDP